MPASIKAYLAGRHMSVAEADTILACTTTKRKKRKADRERSSRGTKDSVKSFETLSPGVPSPKSPAGSALAEPQTIGEILVPGLVPE